MRWWRPSARRSAKSVNVSTSSMGLTGEIEKRLPMHVVDDQAR
jgi:hypothetical protein